jgi:hypothetical protein
MTDNVLAPPVSPLAQAQARLGVAKPSSPTLQVEWRGVTHTLVLGQFTIREKYTIRLVLKAAGLPEDNPDLATAAAIWVHLNRLDPSVTLDDVLDNVCGDDFTATDATEGHAEGREATETVETHG